MLNTLHAGRPDCPVPIHRRCIWIRKGYRQFSFLLAKHTVDVDKARIPQDRFEVAHSPVFGKPRNKPDEFEAELRMDWSRSH